LGTCRLGNLKIWGVATLEFVSKEFVTWEVALGKIRLGKSLTRNDKISFYNKYFINLFETD